MRGLLFAGVFAAPLVFLAACSKQQPPADGSPTGAKGFQVPTEVTLTEGGVAEIESAVKDTKDAVVLVEFWTMASEPSADLALESNTRGGNQQARGETLGKDKVAWNGVRKAEFLGVKYGGYFLRVILVNVDGPAKKDEVLKFLKDRNALHVTNLMWTGDAAAAKERYGYTGKTPHQVVFGRKGNRVWATGEELPAATLDQLLFLELDK